MAACPVFDDPATPSWARLELQGYIGGAWQVLHTETLTPPTDPTGYGDSNTRTLTGSATFDAALTCDLRLVVTYYATISTPSNDGSLLTTSVRVTDWRTTSVDTTDACSGSSGSGGDEEGGGGSGCICSWTEASPVSTTYTESAPVSSTYTESAPVTTTYTRRAC